MSEQEITKIIKQEFNVYCIVLNGYWTFNAPFNMEGEELRELRRKVAARISELEGQAS